MFASRILSRNKLIQINNIKIIANKIIGFIQIVNKLTKNCFAFIRDCQLP